jgi:hypothetical protein
MLVIKYVLIAGAVGLLLSAAGILLFDAYRVARSLVPPPVRWRLATRLAVLAWLPLLPALSIAVVPSGMAGVRVSQVSGTLGSTLYPGTHFILPLIHHVELFTARDQIFNTRVEDSSWDAADAMQHTLPLKEKPLLIQKIIAERLSDKVQIMMVPTDGTFFFANDVLKASPLATSVSLSER